jgi:geranylgeranyl transferase type-2 subunit beta
MVEAFKSEAPFKADLHYANLLKMDQTSDPDAIGFFMNEHLKMSGAYWCIGSLKLMRKLTDERREEMIRFIVAC